MVNCPTCNRKLSLLNKSIKIRNKIGNKPFKKRPPAIVLLGGRHVYLERSMDTTVWGEVIEVCMVCLKTRKHKLRYRKGTAFKYELKSKGFSYDARVSSVKRQASTSVVKERS